MLLPRRSLLSLFVVLSSILHLSWSCLPAAPMSGYYPAAPPAAYSSSYLGGYRPPYAVAVPRGPGPWRSEGQPTAQALDSAPVSVGSGASFVTLNCRTFSDGCRWANTNEDELEWKVMSGHADSDRWLGAVGTDVFPDDTAAALISGPRAGWEGGMLVADALPCFPTGGARLLLTYWTTRVGQATDWPRLHLCSRNVGDERQPLTNCRPFEVRNGVPVSLDVPAPAKPNLPTQVILFGNNFGGPDGGALFLQDIVVEHSGVCDPAAGGGGSSSGSAPLAPSQDVVALETGDSPIVQLQETSDALQHINEGDTRPSFGEDALGQSLAPISSGSSSNRHSAPASPLQIHPLSSNAKGSSGSIPNHEMFASCRSLACNPSDFSCTFWRSAGNNRWEIGSSGRAGNPLTGISSTPVGVDKYLVAPFLDSHVSSYSLVTEQLNVPSSVEPVYFCFQEYYATQGLSLEVCTDSGDCFYKRDTMDGGVRQQWRERCARLPVGRYELRVTASNGADNRGELGFLPVRLALRPDGSLPIC